MAQQLAELKVRLAQVHPVESPSDGCQWTDRELEVLELLPSALTIREIGEELFLSRNTVKTYTGRLYTKLDVHSRAEAVRKAGELGLL